MHIFIYIYIYISTSSRHMLSAIGLMTKFCKCTNFCFLCYENKSHDFVLLNHVMAT